MSKVIIVDDHILFRLGIRAANEESFADISIIAECSSAHELHIHLKNGTPILRYSCLRQIPLPK